MSELKARSSMRRTQTMLTVAQTKLDHGTGRFWAYDLCKRSGIKPGSIYPMMSKFLNEGWLIDGWEPAASGTPGRPPRRYYTLTDEGVRALTDAVTARPA